jgi:hypothetical protein
MIPIWQFVALIYTADVNTLQVVEIRQFKEPQECIMFAMAVMEDDSHDLHAACVPTKKLDASGKPRQGT